MATTHYQYAPLKDPTSEIRVIIIQAGEFDDEIRISFCTRPLKSALPQYEALSYVWGDQTERFNAQICGSGSLSHEGTISIGRNLDTAIRHLRYEHEQRVFWIDALCINQKDIGERNSQVSLMAEIYSMATTVTIWLGPEEDDSDKALDMLQFLSQKLEVNSDEFFFLRSRRDAGPEWADLSIPLPFRDGEMNPVAALFGRPYFNRIWVRQEVALATKAVVKVGRKELPWENFRAGVKCVALKRVMNSSMTGDYKTTFTRNVRSVMTLCTTRKAMIGYSDIRDSLQNALCQDPRDRIYAILSLLPWEDRRLGIKPNYSITVEELYTWVTHLHYLAKDNLSLLESCELSTRSLDIPSWVPDFTTHSHCFDPIQSTWSASAWISAQYKYIDRGFVSVAGVVSSKVEQICSLGDINEGMDRVDALRILKAVHDAKPQRLILATQSAFRGNSLEAYCRTFVCNNLADSCESAVSEALPDIAQCVKGLEFLWSSKKSWEEKCESTPFSDAYLSICLHFLGGRCFFWGSGDLIGIAPADTREGDIISVLLGCRVPMVLRPIASPEPTSKWQVVGPCYVHGLMDGEAIYRARLPGTFRSASTENMGDKDKIDGASVHFFNLNDKKKCWNNPAKILTELAEIKVEKFEQNPHLLEVLPETLRDAGVALQEFLLA